MESNFLFDLIASLKKTQSKKKIKEDIKNLGDFKLPLIGTLNKAKTKSQIKQDLSSLNGTVSLTGKINNKSIAASMQQATQQAQKQVNAKPVEMTFSVKKEKLLNDIKLLAQQNSKLFKDTDMSIKYNSLLDSAEMARNDIELSTLRTQLGSLRSELKVTGNAGLTMTDALKNGLSKVLQLFGSHGIIVQFTAQLRKAWTEAKELDKSMTDLSRVNAEITRSGFPDYLDRVIDKTKQLAVAAKDYIDAVTTFSRAGYNLTDSETLADMAVQLEKVGDMDSVSASKALLAGLQGYTEIDGYGMDQLTEKAQALNDKIDLIGNTASISQKEVAEGIQAVGSVMSDANTSVDEFLAMLGAGNRAVQDSDKVALAIRTSALRIRSATADLEEMGETTDGVIESTAKLAEKIKALTNIDGSGGVNILEADEETFRSIYDIYNDISKVYDKMSDKNASALLDLIAGKNRSNQISAILQNMSEANVLLERSLSAAGTASAEYEIYLNGAEAASERFGVAMTEAYNSIINGETVKGLTNTGAAVLELANSWNILEGTIKGFLTLGVLKGVTTLTVAFKNSALQISNYGKSLNAIKDLNTHIQGTEKYIDAMNTLKVSCVNLTDAQLKQVLANRSLSEAQLVEILQLDTLEKEQVQARLSQLGLIQTTETQTAVQGAATASTFSLSAAIKGLGESIKTAFMANPIGVTIMGISLAFSVISTVISKYKESVVDASEATQEAINTFESITTEVETLEGKLSELNDQIKELDPITDAEDIENLKLETEELEKQLVILKEKQRIAGAEADKAAQKSLGITEASRYKTEERESAYGGVETGAAYVTKDEKLLNAIEAYKEYKAKVDEANDALANMAETGEYTDKEWQEQEQTVATYSEKMDDARIHANELAATLEEEKQGLDGNTESSQNLITKIENVITKYGEWLNLINGTTDALEEQKQKEEEVSSKPFNLSVQLTASQESLDKFQSSVKSASDAYAALLSGNYSASELLNSIQTINQAVSDMGGSLNWEFINSQTDSLELLGDAIQHVSQKYAESILSDAGIDIDSEFGQMLANIIQQIYDAEAAFEGMNSQLDNLQSSYQTLTGILESYNETGYISLDNLQSLLTADENLIAMLEVENGQLVLNQQAYENLVAVQLMEFKAKLNDAAAAEIEALAKQKAEQATNQNADASNNAVAKLDAETAAFNRNTSAAIANAVVKAEESGVSEEDIQGIFDKYNEVWDAAVSNFGGDFDGFMGVQASKAGKKAGDAYVSQFEKSLKELQTLRDQGKITEKQYLDYLRKLYQKFFKDKKKYAEQYAKYEHEYLQGMKSLYESALSGITSILDKQISAYGDARDAAVESLEQQRDAAIEVKEAEKERYEQEIDLIDKQIAAKEKVISGIQDEIDAMREANEQRKRELSLQQDEYNLQRLLNQKTKMVYKDGQFVYETDTSGIREAKQKVEDDKLEIEIANKENEIKLIEKEISLLEERKSGINEQIDLLDKEIDQINDYFDKMISDTEKYWDNLIKGMEDYKSRWEELAEIEEQAKIVETLRALGIETGDILGMSEEAFAKFKDDYIGILADIYSGNDSMLSALSDTTGKSVDEMGSYLDATQGYIDSLSGIGESLNPVAEAVGSVDENMGSLSSTASEANENLTETASKTGEVASNVESVSNSLNEMPESGKIASIRTEFDNLADSIGKVAKALGIGEDNAVGTLFQAMSNLNTITLGGEAEGIIGQFTLLKQAITDVIDIIGLSEEQAVGSLMGAITQLNSITLDESIIQQFTNLKTAIDSVTAAISGGGGESSGGESQGGSGSKQGGESGGKTSKGESSGGNSLTGAIEQMGETAAEVIGEPDAEGDGTVIGEFGSMETAVNDVRDAIGTEGSEGQGGSSGGEGDDTLVGSIEYLGDKTEEEMGTPDGEGIIGRFTEFKNVIEEAANQVKSISEGLEVIDGQEVECSITVNVKMNGSIPAFASGTVLGNMQIESATYNAKYGKAFASGTIGLPHAEKNALVSEYGQTEMTVLPDGKTIVTDTPTMMDLPKDTVIYNEEETKKIMDNKIDASGNVHNPTAQKEVADPNSTIILPDGSVATPISMEEYVHTLQQRSNPKHSDNAQANSAGDGSWIGADGHKYRDLQPGDRAYELQKAFEPLVKKIREGHEEFLSNAYFEHTKQMEKWTKEITNNTAINNVTNNNKNVQQPVTIHQNVTLNCPNVTNNSGVEQQLKSLHLKAMQVPLNKNL